MSAHIITVAIEKGGNGKTTTTINLATLFAQDGKRVLVVDMDPQANSTHTLTGLKKTEWKGRGVYDMIRVFDVAGVDLHQFITPTQIEGVDMIPSSVHTPQLLEQLSIFKEMHGRPKYMFLSATLAHFGDEYDYIFIDSPPSLDDLAVSGLFAADSVILPVKADEYSVEGLMNTYALIQMLEKEENIKIDILGILHTIVERTSLTEAIRQRIKESEFGEYVFDAQIRKGQVVNESTSMCMPVVLYAKNSYPAKDYMKLYREILQRLGVK